MPEEFTGYSDGSPSPAVEEATKAQLPAVMPDRTMAQHEGVRGVAESVSAKAKAMVEAQFLMAQRIPRVWEQVRLDVISACQRPLFARKALYEKPIGGKKYPGLSIRFAEMASQAMGNMLEESFVLHEDEREQVVGVFVCDLQRNRTLVSTFTLQKSVERTNAAGREVIGSRKNSQGGTTYIVVATEDELRTKRAAESSKHRRNLILQHVPADILEEAQTLVTKIRNDRHAKDPNAAKRDVVDQFYSLGIKPADLEGYLDHSLDVLTAPELADLESIANALESGEGTFQDFIDLKERQKETRGEPGTKAPASDSKGTAGLKKDIASAKSGETEGGKQELSPEAVRAKSWTIYEKLEAKGAERTYEENDKLRRIIAQYPDFVKGGGGA